MGKAAEIAMNRHEEKIREVVEREARKAFRKAGIGNVYVKENDYWDIFHIAIFMEDIKAVESGYYARFMGSVSNAMRDELNEEQFPVINNFPKESEEKYLSLIKKGYTM